MDLFKPDVIEETSDYVVVYKPPKMHSAPLKQGEGGALADRYEGQLMHRLDFETHGLVLFAKNQKSYNFFKDLQDKGEFVKEYSAVCTALCPDTNPQAGFPPRPHIPHFPLPTPCSPLTIMSYFRPYGPGRKQVRPVTDSSSVPNKDVAKDKGGFYRTEIINILPCEGTDNRHIFTVRIKRGFRHQIRCHLTWLGYPILNDPLYGQQESSIKTLALCAHALFFTDPLTGEKKECRIKPIMV